MWEGGVHIYGTPKIFNNFPPLIGVERDVVPYMQLLHGKITT